MSQIQETLRSLFGFGRAEPVPTYDWKNIASNVTELEEKEVYNYLKDNDKFLVSIKDPGKFEMPNLSEDKVHKQFEQIRNLQDSSYPTVDRELAELHRDLEEGHLKDEEYQQRVHELVENIQDRYAMSEKALEPTERSLERALTSTYDSDIVFSTIMEDIVQWEQLRQGGYYPENGHDDINFWMAHEIYNLAKGEN